VKITIEGHLVRPLGKTIGYSPEVIVGETPDPIDHADDATWYVPALSLEIVDEDDLNLSDGTVTDGGGSRTFTNPEQANDGDATTPARRASFAGTGTSILKTDLGTGFEIESVFILGGSGAVATATGAVVWELEHSDDGAAWTATAVTQSNGAIGDKATSTLTLTAPSTHRYWRIIHTYLGGGFTSNLWVSTWALSGDGVSLGGIEWTPAPAVHDGDDASFDYITEDTVTEAALDFLRADLGYAPVLESIEMRLGLEDAGSATISVFGSNDEDFDSETLLDSVTFTGTGSYTAQDIAFTLPGGTGYRYLRFAIAVAQGIHVHEVSLFGPTLEGSHDHTHDHDDDYLTVRYGGGDVLSTVGTTGATETIDLANGNVHNITLDDDCTFTFTAVAADRARSFRLYLWQDGTGGHVVTWPGSVEWAGGAPTISTTADSLSVFMFETLDGGTIWHGYPVGGGGTGSSGPDVELVENAATGATETVDVSVARTYDLTLTADLTLTLSGAVNNEAHYVTIAFRQDGTGGWDVTHPGSVVWADGAPTIDPDPGGVTWVTYASLDGGTVWYGFPIGGTGGGGGPVALDDLTDVVITTPAEGHEIKYRSGFWVNEVPTSPRWEVVMTGVAPPEPVTNDAEDDWLYAPA
jgi:hypothetical protein